MNVMAPLCGKKILPFYVLQIHQVSLHTFPSTNGRCLSISTTANHPYTFLGVIPGCRDDERSSPCFPSPRSFIAWVSNLPALMSSASTRGFISSVPTFLCLRLRDAIWQTNECSSSVRQSSKARSLSLQGLHQVHINTQDSGWIDGLPCSTIGSASHA